MGQHMAYGFASGQKVPPMPARVSAWGIYHQFIVENGEIVFVGVTSDKQWLRFCAEFERPDLLANDEIATNNGRVLAQDWLLPDLRAMFAAMSKDEVIRRCETANLPFSPVAHPEDLFDDPQLLAGGSLLDVTLTDGRETRLPRVPVLVGEHEFGVRRQPPQVGEQTDKLLSELGYSAEEIADFRDTGLIA
jgi:crotonobetainyl-CoA:carnitine CoA-transferase CaiB-like acyl-CoA transferase